MRNFALDNRLYSWDKWWVENIWGSWDYTEEEIIKNVKNSEVRNVVENWWDLDIEEVEEVDEGAHIMTGPYGKIITEETIRSWLVRSTIEETIKRANYPEKRGRFYWAQLSDVECAAREFFRENEFTDDYFIPGTKTLSSKWKEELAKEIYECMKLSPEVNNLEGEGYAEWSERIRAWN